jgi:hypothetical protein
MKNKLDRIIEEYDEVLKMDGYDDCIEGICNRFGQEPIICYNYEKVIEKLISEGMTYEEAVEYHEYNQIGAYIGEKTPCFLTKY